MPGIVNLRQGRRLPRITSDGRKVAKLSFVAGCALLSLTVSMSAQKRTSRPAKNNCVDCHSRLAKPLELSGRFLDWRRSAHQSYGVTCDKCHGGDPAARDSKLAHAMVRPPSDDKSRLSGANLPETCGKCHRDIVASFVESNHYTALKANNLGPTCNSCHAHMASTVARRPSDGASLCAACHNIVDGPQPMRLDIPKRAERTLESLQRAEQTLRWARELLAEARKRRLKTDDESEDLRLAEITLKEAKVGWHVFDPEGPSVKAENAYDEAFKLKEKLKLKVGHD